MSTIDDLRDTLDRHASDLHDDGLHERTGAVRGRVRVVRRRRRAAAAGAAAAVVAAVALGTSLLAPDRAPVAGRTLVGHEAPETMTSLGYTYSFARGVEGAGRVTVHLGASDAPRLVSWATAGSDDEVTLRRAGEPTTTVTAEDFGDFVLVPESGGTVTVSGSGRVALAAYDLSGQAPGDTVDGVTFRRDVAGQRLLGSAIGRPGQAQARVSVAVEPGQLPIAFLCSGAPKDAWFRVSGGHGRMIAAGSGCDDSTFDPAGRGGVTMTVGGRRTRQVHLAVAVTRGEHGPAITDDPDLRVGIAAYAPAATVTDLAGMPLHLREEYGGHLWMLSDTERSTPGEPLLTVQGVGGSETLVVMNYAGSGRKPVRTLVDGRRGSEVFLGDGAGSTQRVIPATGGSVGLEVGGSRVPDGLRLGLARYVRAD